jgi:hypothetical protein
MLESITPSDHFTNSANTEKITKAIYLAKTASGDAFTVVCNVTGSAVNFVSGGQLLPVRTRAAVTATGYTIVYFY